MDQTFFTNRWFRVMAGTVGVLLIIFLVFASLLKMRETWEAYRHASFPQKTLNVSADGKTKAVPDTAYLSFTIIGNGKDAQTAQQDSAKKLKEFTDFLTSQNVDKEDINVTQSYTSQDTSQPYDPSGKGPMIDTKTVSVEVKGKDSLVARFSNILKWAEAKNMTNTAGSNSCLTFEKVDELLKPAREEAMKAATEKAQQLARLGGLTLGKAVAVMDNSPIFQYTYTPTGYGGGTCGTVPVADMELAPQEITANLNVTYEVK